ncbi:hypothetical protein J0A68_04415 [Algoriphagus sp. H41]|uniref:Uncharacterized protein n=1 Tax=Algoriphagus oliviformis TaxID=2811231 RepID=A0ABS3BZB3_9BACT|nr:DUF6364 family protein [Algoriphagus oliviformis]MBN7810188.1 hypothetical protein [Algoriphagus oliviformis]
MTTKLTLDINEALVAKARKYAEAQGQSISDLIESLLEENLPAAPKESQKPRVKDPELVKRILDGTEPLSQNLLNLRGALKGVSEDDVENARWEYLKKKHDL